MRGSCGPQCQWPTATRATAARLKGCSHVTSVPESGDRRRRRAPSRWRSRRPSRRRLPRRDPPPRTSPAAPPGWLAQQLIGGTHLDFAGTKFVDYGGSADAAFALAAAHAGRGTIHDVVDYFAAHLDDYADYSGAQGGPYYGSVGKAAVAALVDGRNPNNFGGHHLLHRAQGRRVPDQVDHRLHARQQLEHLLERVDVVHRDRRSPRRRSATVLSSRRRPTSRASSCRCSVPTAGSAPTCRPATRASPIVDATGYALMALQALGGHAAQIKHAAAWLVSQRNARRVVELAGRQEHRLHRARHRRAAISPAARPRSRWRWLRSQQVTSGPTVGKGAKRGALRYQGKFDPASSIKATSDGILGITRSSLATLDLTGVTRSRPRAGAGPAATSSTPTVQPGGTETVTGTGFARGERVVASIHSRSRGQRRRQ